MRTERLLDLAICKVTGILQNGISIKKSKE
jgi:hypothetical protein